jgi:hypothetical protein
MLRTESWRTVLGRGSWPAFRRGVSGLAVGAVPRARPPSAAQPLLSLLVQARLQKLSQRLGAVRTLVGQYQSRLNAIEAVIATQLGAPPSSELSAVLDTTISAAATSPSAPARLAASLPVSSRGVSDRALFSIFCELDYEDFSEDDYPRARVVNGYLDDDEQVDQATVQTSYDRFLHTPTQIHEHPSDRNRRLDSGEEREESGYRHGPQGPDDERVEDSGRTERGTGITKGGAPGMSAHRRASSRTRTSGTSPRITSRKK